DLSRRRCTAVGAAGDSAGRLHGAAASATRPLSAQPPSIGQGARVRRLSRLTLWTRTAVGQLVPTLPQAIRVARFSPKEDDRKPHQASSFKNSSRRSMTSPFEQDALDALMPTKGGELTTLGTHVQAAGSRS